MITRRQALKTALLAGGLLATPVFRHLQATEPTPAAPQPSQSKPGPFSVPELPYAYNALEPHIDEQTMRIHHDKHHAAYVQKLNDAIASQPQTGIVQIEDLLRNLAKVDEKIRLAVRNNGGGHYNHSLFWQMMSPNAGSEPSGELAKSINAQFGSFADFKKAFSKEATGLFGSGWVWLVLDGRQLKIEPTANQDSPISQGRMPLLGIDVWEHAYYLKRQNRRAEYIEAWWNVVNWDFVTARYKSATA